jgi:hypothetical protein
LNQSQPSLADTGGTEPRAFILRVRIAGGAGGLVVTVDDVAADTQSHFPNLEDAFATIRRALKQPGFGPGQPH